MTDEDKIPDYKGSQWQNRVGPIDLAIMRLLLDGHDLDASSLADAVKKDYNFEVEPQRVLEKIDRLVAQGVIRSKQTIAVDPVKLYDYVFLVFIKLHLPSLISKATTTWKVATKNILRISDENGSPIRILFTVLGWGEYDLVGFVYVDDIDRYYRFQEALAEEGFIERYDSKELHRGIDYRFEPLAVPDPNESRGAIAAYLPLLEELKEE